MNDGGSTGIVRQVYAGFARKDLPAILEMQAEDAQWSVAGPPDLIPWAAPPPGKEGVAQFLRTLGQYLAAERFEIRDYLESGDTVVALGFQSGRVLPNDVSYEFEFVHVWTLRQGRVASFRVYYDTSYVVSRLKASPSESTPTG